MPKPTYEEKYKLVDDWLQSLHSILWMNWDISKPERRKLAVEELIRIYTQLDHLFWNHEHKDN